MIRCKFDKFLKKISCIYRFNEGFLGDNVERQNTNHGGLALNVENVIFTHGELDPWRTVGVEADLNAHSPAFVIKGASQSKDMGLISEFDSDDLIKAKLSIIKILNGWIENDISSIRNNVVL